MRRRRVLALLLATAAGTAAGSSLAAAPASAESCVTRLPLRITLPSSFAASYTRGFVPVRIASNGPTIRFARIGIYTFGGLRVAYAVVPGIVTGRERVVSLRLRFGRMQAGRFTLYASGEPNANRSCGPKNTSRVQTFRGCPPTLPVSFPTPPGGVARDYGGYLSVQVHSLGVLLDSLDMTVYDFAGNLVGESTQPILFGDSTFDNPLTVPLQPGGYTVLLDGRVRSAPACGLRRARLVIGFG